MWLFPHMTKVTCIHSHNLMKLANELEEQIMQFRKDKKIGKLS